TRRGRRTAPSENLRGLSRVHGERGLVELEHLPVQDPAGRDPRWPLARRDQELEGACLDERRDEPLGVGCAGDLLVLVDHEPAVLGPRLEVLAEKLREDVDAVCRRGNGLEMLAETNVASVDQFERRACDAEREGGDVGRRAPRPEPRTTAAATRDPLLCKGRLAVAGRCNEGADSCGRLVEEREKSRTLDDSASLQSARLPDCRRHPHPRDGGCFPRTDPTAFRGGAPAATGAAAGAG